MSYNYADFDDIIKKYNLGHPRNKYFLDLDRCVAITYGKFNEKTHDYEISPSQKYRKAFEERLEEGCITVADKKYVRLYHFLMVLKKQSAINEHMKEFIKIYELVELREFSDIPLYVPKIVDVNNVLITDISNELEQYVKKYESIGQDITAINTKMNDLIQVMNRMKEIGKDYPTDIQKDKPRWSFFRSWIKK